MGTDRLAGRSKVLAREWPSGAFRVVVGIWALVLAALVLGAAAADLPGIVELTVFVVPFGLLFPVYFLSLHVVVRATGSELRVAVWPLVFPTRVAFAAVRTVDVRAGAALRHHGGFVPVVGPAQDRVLGFNQDAEVRITYESADEQHHLSILAGDADELAETIRQACQVGVAGRARDSQSSEEEAG